MTAGPVEAVARLDGVTHRYGRTRALDGLSLALPAGVMAGLIGPDGVGKSTLLGLIAGARRIQSGRIAVLGGDLAARSWRDRIGPRIAYMPQGLGRNLYPDLSVRENVDFFGRLFGLVGKDREARITELLRSTQLQPFADRLARHLSGGMKQKLGLCCALIHDPDLLILDEPTTGVDPLSRRQFWALIARIRARRPGMSVLVATAYMEEATGFDWLAVMNAGRLLATGTPAALKAQTGAATLEEVFLALLPGRPAHHPPLPVPARADMDGEPVIVARGLTRRFGGFTAVDHVDVAIGRGEIFGFLGSNGCGKTTTMKMLTGLLPASEGEIRLFGRPSDERALEARRRVGYMSQGFSLYQELTVRQNLDLHARLFQLPATEAKARTEGLMERFGLSDHEQALAGDLPLGIRQRLSLAVAVVHEPEMLILDEPTSGVDPVARDRFWELLIDLSRRRGVTIFVSTHFMNEAARCDRVSLMHAGRILATGAPAELVRTRGAASLDEAFIGFLEEAGQRAGGTAAQADALPLPSPAVTAAPGALRRDGRPGMGLRRLSAYAHRETLELLRDPIRLIFALLGTVVLMVIFGFGITMDVEGLSFAALDRDQTPQSRAYLREFSGSRYFTEHPPVEGDDALDRRLRNGELQLTLEVPPNFGRNLAAGRPTEVAAWIDGAMPFRAETIRGYVEGVHRRYLAEMERSLPPDPAVATIETRFRYNQDFKSVYAMVPSVIALLLVMIPAILTALAVVREKELGTITNFYVTPVRRIEFLLGKQLPYIVLAMVNVATLIIMATWLFDVPLKGDPLALGVGALLYVTTTTGIGLLVSAFTRTQTAALFVTVVLTVVPATQFSGMTVPVSTLSGSAAVIGALFPTSYFLATSVGVFTKAFGFREAAWNLAALAAFIPVVIGASIALLRKQDR